MNKENDIVSETKFTPGPWAHGGHAVYVQGMDVARVYQSFGVSDETFEANARLIAAAPELYEAVRRLRQFPLYVARDNGSEAVAAEAFADAALAKAVQP